MSRSTPLPSDLQDAPFAVSVARRMGVSESRLRASDLEVPFHGIRRSRLAPVAEPDTDDERAQQRFHALLRDCASFQRREGRSVIFSHVTAARLFRMPLPWRLETRRFLDVAALTPDHAPQGAGIIGHRLTRGAYILSTSAGFAVPAPLRVWAQLAPLLSVDELVVVGDHLVRRKQPFTSFDELVETVAGWRRLRGIRKLRLAALSVRSGTDSAAESRMRLALTRAGLPEPVIGFTVYDRDGCFVGTPDLAYLDERVALEYEGEIHRVDSRTFRSDIERRERFQDADWRHIRVTRDHLTRPHTLVDRVGFALAQRRRIPPPIR
ncbi:hypothetical protein BKA04_001917 [Cryobacterium mesophilum]|uniref:DUF559 domain-containing protein n=1 Tax=Terrimesophilobacter mesophilus TaxID=433647 RepID=A0A4R8VC41_9MICO|nr:hypothetical protein [Terrimesophilobacter mesophilus]MBB5633694.1 hypothetical protein [Terrimesophilobacter mesophilus]TFB80383.1 hypothetical protein E3N84_10295 [Terrimesophilobacter mesophilus]